jgi:hypothetical protein
MRIELRHHLILFKISYPQDLPELSEYGHEKLAPGIDWSRQAPVSTVIETLHPFISPVRIRVPVWSH